MAFPSDCPPATEPEPGTVPFPPSTGSGHAVSDVWPGQVCRNGFDRSDLTSLFVQFLQYHFSDPVAHGVRHPFRDKPWVAGLKSGIQIFGEGDQDPPPEAYPAILVRAGAERNAKKLGIGNRVSAPFGQSRSYGEARVGFHTIICQGRTVGEADRLAAEVDGAVSAFLPQFRQLMELAALDFGQREEPVKIADTENSWAVAIGYAWAYTRDARISQHAPLIRDTVVATSPRAPRRPAGF